MLIFSLLFFKLLCFLYGLSFSYIRIGRNNLGSLGGGLCSTFVLTEVETLGVARSLGWKVHMRCANGYREGTRVYETLRLSASSLT